MPRFDAYPSHYRVVYSDGRGYGLKEGTVEAWSKAEAKKLAKLKFKAVSIKEVSRIVDLDELESLWGG